MNPYDADNYCNAYLIVTKTHINIYFDTKYNKIINVTYKNYIQKYNKTRWQWKILPVNLSVIF